MTSTETRSQASSEFRAVAPAAERSTFEASDCLLGKIHAALESSSATMIANPHGRVLIDPASKLFCEATPEREAFFIASPKSARITRPKMGPGGRWRPVDELLWEAAYHGSNGALLTPLNPLTAVRMVRWPNLTRISHTPAMISLCALMHKRALSTTVAIRLLQAPADEVRCFFSAALASGLARQVGEVPGNGGANAFQSRASRRVSSFWSQLFEKLTGR